MNAVAYCRFSSDNQRDESIDAQLRAIREFCVKEGHTLVRVYTDEARSATTDDRPRFLDMVHDSRAGSFQVAIVHKLDRFARNRYDSAFYRRKLRDNGVRLVSVLEPMDDSPESIILESVLEGMAEYYSKNLSREVKKGQKENALIAKHNGGTPPLGYDVKDGQYVINEYEAEAVRKIFTMYIDGHGYGSIATALNASGFRAKRGRPFGKNSIRDLLLNEKFTGVYKFAKGCQWEVRTEDAIPQIIDKEIFDMAQDKIKSRVRGPRLNGDRVYLLTGLMECGECGASYSGGGYVNGRSQNYYTYACINSGKDRDCTNPKLRKEMIEDHVIDALKERFFTDEHIERIANDLIKHASTFNTENTAERERLTKQRALLQQKMDRAFDLALDGLMDKATLASQSARIKADLDAADARIAELPDDVPEWMTRDNTVAYLKHSRATLNDESPSVQRQIVQSFVEKVVVFKDRVDIVIRINPHPDSRTGVRLVETRGIEPLSKNT